VLNGGSGGSSASAPKVGRGPGSAAGPGRGGDGVRRGEDTVKTVGGIQTDGDKYSLRDEKEALTSSCVR
jgi:hypothetical protein